MYQQAVRNSSGTEFTITEVFRNLGAINNGSSPINASIPGQNNMVLRTKLQKNRICQGEAINGVVSLFAVDQNLNLVSVSLDLSFNVRIPGEFLAKNKTKSKNPSKLIWKKSKSLNPPTILKKSVKEEEEEEKKSEDDLGSIPENLSLSLEKENGEKSEIIEVPLFQHFPQRRMSGGGPITRVPEDFTKHNETLFRIRKSFQIFSLNQPRLKRDYRYDFPFVITLEEVSLVTLDSEENRYSFDRLLESQELIPKAFGRELKIECFLQVAIRKKGLTSFGSRVIEKFGEPIPIFIEPKDQKRVPLKKQFLIESPVPKSLGFFQSLCRVREASYGISTVFSHLFMGEEDSMPIQVSISSGEHDISEFLWCSIKIVTSFQSEDTRKQLVVYEESKGLKKKLRFEIFPSLLSSFVPSMSCASLSFSTKAFLKFEGPIVSDLVLAEQPIELLPPEINRAKTIRFREIRNKKDQTYSTSMLRGFQALTLPFSQLSFVNDLFGSKLSN